MKTPADELRDARDRVSSFSKTITSVVLLVLLYLLSTGPVAAIGMVHYGPHATVFHKAYLAPAAWCAARCDVVRRYCVASEARCVSVYCPLFNWWHMAPPETARRDLIEIVRDAPEVLACGSPLNSAYSVPNHESPTPNP